MHSKQLVAISATAACVAAQTTRSAADTSPTEVTGCNSRGDEGLFCFDGSDEWVVISTQHTEENLPDSFDSCHLQAGILHCADGNEAATLVFASASSEEEPDDDDDDDDQDQAEETSSTVSTGGASTMVTSAVTVATGSSNSTGFENITSSSTTTSAPPPPPTAVSFCQPRDKTKLFCMAASYEWEVISEWDAKNPPSSFEDCDVHGEELHCVDGDEDATLVPAAANSGSTTESDKAETESDGSASAATISSRFGQAGVLLSACLLAYAAYAF